MLKLTVLAFLILLAIYLILVGWLHHNLSTQAVSISQAAGVPIEGEQLLKGLLSWLLAFALLPAFVGLVLEGLNPFRSNRRIFVRLGLLILLGFAVALLPHGLRMVRGVDQSGLPTLMEPANPEKVCWWSADGTAVLFHSREDDGSIRFWNRPGITPDTGQPGRPGTRSVREEWEKTCKEEERSARQAEEKEEQQRMEEERLLHEKSQEEAQLKLREEAAKTEIQKARAEIEAATARAMAEAGRAEAESARAAKLASERETLQTQLAQLRKEQQQELIATRAPAASSNREAHPTARPWESRQVRPGQYLFNWGFRHAAVEIRLPVECEIEVQGSRPRIYKAGSHTIPLPSHGNFRVRSKSRHTFDIHIRPASVL